MNKLPEISGFIRTAIENLQKLTSTQMEYKLRKDGKIISQSERRRIIFTEICEFLTLAINRDLPIESRYGPTNEEHLARHLLLFSNTLKHALQK